MKARAAIQWERNVPWSVEEIDLQTPRSEEVMVRWVASGMCHSDDHARTGDMLTALPVVGGHEGAGIVEEVGPNVTRLKPGDHVAASYIPACGKCPSCAGGHQNLCDNGYAVMTGRAMVDDTYRVSARGQDVGMMALVGTFSTYSTVHHNSLVKIDEEIPLEYAAVVSCGVATGWGSAVYVGEVRAGEVVVVVGCGGLGMSAIQGARFAGAEQIIAVDPVAFKRETALKLGATDVAASMEEALPLVIDRTRGRLADVAILTVGVAHGTMIEPLMAFVKKGGRGVITAVTPSSETTVTLPLQQFTLWQKQLRGNTFGGCNPQSDIPKLLRLNQLGHLDLDTMITARYPLDEVNQGYADLLAGKNIRGVIAHES